MIVNITPFLDALKDINSSLRKKTLEYVSEQQVSTNCCLCNSTDTNFLLCWKCFYKLHPKSVDFKVSFVVECALMLSSVLKNEALKDSEKLGASGHEYKQESCKLSHSLDETPHGSTHSTKFQDVLSLFCKLEEKSFVFENQRSSLLGHDIEKQNACLHMSSETLRDESWLKMLQHLGLDLNKEDLHSSLSEDKLENMSSDERAIAENIRRKIDLNTARKWREFKCKSKMEVANEQLNILKLRYFLFLKDLKFDDALTLKNSIIEIERNKRDLLTQLGEYSRR